MPSAAPARASQPEVAIREGRSTAALRPAPPLRPARENAGSRSSVFRLIPYLKPYWKEWIVMVVTALLATFASIAIPLLTRRIIDGPVQHHDSKGLWTLGLAALALGGAEAILWFARRWMVSIAAMGTEADLRKDMYARMQSLPMAFHSKWQGGQLLSRIMSDLSTVRRFLGFGLLFLVLNALQVVIVTALLLQMYWPLGLIVLVSAAPIMWMTFTNERKFKRISRAIQDQTGDVAGSVEESAQGVRVIKAFGRADHVFEGFNAKSERLYESSMEKVRLSAWFWTVLELIPNVTLVLVMGVGAWAVADGHITIGTLVAFLTLMLSLVWPIASIGFLLTMTQEAMTAADRICEVFDAPLEIADGDTELVRPRGHLQFQDVGFRFPDSDVDVFSHVDLDIAAGETMALVGSTGSGKSVLTALVPRLYDVTEGRILLDGVDIRDLTLDSLRTQVANAFEDPTLFSMSVRENLTLGRPDATDEEIAEALAIAQAEFVHDLPWGLDTRIGEQGLSLSGGQRQRLALARAVITKPAVLVLDDTLSALDVHTEALVEEALRRVLVGVTGIVVAHRASTVLLADRVALLEGGRITHVGTHAELLATVPAYRFLLAADDELDDEERTLAEDPYIDRVTEAQAAEAARRAQERTDIERRTEERA